MKHLFSGIALVLSILACGAPAEEKDSTAQFAGTSFAYSRDLAESVDARVEPAAPLAYPTDKPDGVGPEHTLFAFRRTGMQDGAASPAREAPALRIYPVAAYESIWSPSRATIDSLHSLLTRRTTLPAGEIPFLPWADATQPFRSHLKRIAFADGEGFGFVTAYAIEAAPVTNRELEYTFQGLTSDGATYVSLSFPIQASILAAEEEVADWEAFARAYDGYIVETARRLDQLPPDGFSPNLDRIEAMVRSIRVGNVGAGAK